MYRCATSRGGNYIENTYNPFAGGALFFPNLKNRCENWIFLKIAIFMFHTNTLVYCTMPVIYSTAVVRTTIKLQFLAGTVNNINFFAL